MINIMDKKCIISPWVSFIMVLLTIHATGQSSVTNVSPPIVAYVADQETRSPKYADQLALPQPNTKTVVEVSA